jgi:hypothetical protein
MIQYGQIDACQVCERKDLRSVLFLGYLPPVNSMRPIGTQADQEYWYPADFLYCPSCHLVQLGFAVDPNILFPPEYPYTSGSTRILRENFADLYREVNDMKLLTKEDLIVDVGSNDGTLLSNFQNAGHRVLGIEPTLTGEIALSRGIPTVRSFFNMESVNEITKEYGHPRVVTAANVFAHIHGIHSVVQCIEQLVGEEGVFISESHYLRDLIHTLQYDTIYHEHLRYYSVSSLKYLLESHGLRVFHVKRIPSHGGSIRVYATKSKNYPTQPSVQQILDEEGRDGLRSENWIAKFRERVVQSKLDLYTLLTQIRTGGKKIYGIGAPSRASTLITYVGLDEGTLDCVLEIKTSKKINKYVPGKSIPVLEESKLFEEQPAYALLLSWHIADELTMNLKRKGYRGDFLIPLPHPRIMPNEKVMIE